MDNVIALCKRRGFVYPTSEIYGGLANAYDYGPLGVELMKNIKDCWWQTFVHERDDMVGLDSQIILHPQTWVASGHVASFSDPLVEDIKTHIRYRADHLIEAWIAKSGKEEFSQLKVEDMTIDEMGLFIQQHGVKSPSGNEISKPKTFNLLFESYLGSVAGEKSKVYLRGETAQGIFSNFKNIIDSTRVKLPFGVAQIGKSFRNEITTGQFVFRTFELEQAEIEYFFDPETTEWQPLFEMWKNEMWKFVTERLGIRKDSLRWRKHTDKERSHYSKDTYDLDYHFPFGWKELWGIAYRTDYDLRQHSSYSGKELVYRNQSTNKTFIPHVIEPAVGVNRMFFMVLLDAYREEKVGDNIRIYLDLPANLAPVKIAIFPLQKDVTLKKEAEKLYHQLKRKFVCEFDDAGNIGKMYRRQDEIGTPFCVTVDYETLKDKAVTIRHRNTMKQERIAIDKLETTLESELL